MTTIKTMQEHADADIKTFYTGWLGLEYEPPEVLDLELSDVEECYVDKSPAGRPTDRTVGADVQGNRIEYCVVDWYGEAPYVLKHDVVWTTFSRAYIPLDLLAPVLRKYRPKETHIDRGGNHRQSDFRVTANKYLRQWIQRKTIRFIKGEAKGIGEAMILGTTRGGGPLDMRINVDETKADVHRLIHSKSSDHSARCYPG